MDNEGDKTGQRFAAQLTAHRARVFAYVLTHVGANVTIAEDVTQDCFVRVFEAREQRPPPDGALYAYLRTTARNLLRDRFRRETCLRAADVETADTPDDRTPENQLVLRETAERLAAEVALMPPVLRETLRLRAVEGLDYPAIAARMDCPVGTVRSLLHAARTRLRDGLAAAETVALGDTATVRTTEQHTTPRTGTTTTRYKEQKTMASTIEMAQIRAELQAMQARLTALETNKEESMGGTPDPWDAAIRHFGGDLVRERHEKGSGFALGLVHIVTQSAETGGGAGTALGIRTFGSASSLPDDDILARNIERMRALSADLAVCRAFRHFYALRFAGKEMRATAAELAEATGESANKITTLLLPLVADRTLLLVKRWNRRRDV